MVGELEGGTMTSIKADITPFHLRCSIGGCPAVMTLSDGDLLIIGKRLAPDLLEEIKGRIAQDEFAVKINPDYFRNIFK
jgi:hypothetical protein